MSDVHTKRSTGPEVTALGMSTFAFAVCFAVWTLFSIIGVRIKQDLGLSETEFGLLVATPILTGSLSRIFLGIWTDQYGGRTDHDQDKDKPPWALRSPISARHFC